MKCSCLLPRDRSDIMTLVLVRLDTKNPVSIRHDRLHSLHCRPRNRLLNSPSTLPKGAQWPHTLITQLSPNRLRGVVAACLWVCML